MSDEETTLTQVEVLRREALRTMILSKGLGMILVGAAMLVVGLALSWLPEGWPYALPFGLLCGLGMGLLPLWAEKQHAKKAFHVRTFRKTTRIEWLILLVGIPAGVAALYFVTNAYPGLMENEQVCAVLLGAMMVAASGYFFFLATRLSLFEYAFAGAAFAVLALLVVISGFHAPLAQVLEKNWVFMIPSMGLLLLCMGASLHRRWQKYRTQALALQSQGDVA